MESRKRSVGRYVWVAAWLGLAGCGGSAGIEVEVLERLPVADAGPDVVARVGVAVTLDGRASVDPEGQALAFSWREPPEAPGTLTDPTRAAPTFVPTTAGTYVFDLLVTAGGTTSPPDAVTVVVVDDLSATPRRPPAAEPRAAKLSHAVFLPAPPAGDLHSIPPMNRRADGSVLPATIVDLASDTTDDPAAAAVLGLWRVEVVVAQVPFAVLWFPALIDPNDTGDVGFDPTLVTPVVAYGVVGQSFVLDGTRSSDDEVVKTWMWTQVGGPFRYSTDGNVIGVVPQTPGTYTFELVVTDNVGLTSFPQRIVVPVLPAGLPGAGPPVARLEVLSGATETDVGGRKVWRSRAGHRVVLDDGGSEARAGGSLTFHWTQTGGPPALVEGAASASPTFTPTVPGAYVFELMVTDVNGVSDAARIDVSVGTPDADGPAAALAAIPDAFLLGGGVVIVLDGAASEGAGVLEHRWTQVRGPPCFADPIGPAMASVAIDQPGTYEFQLRVFDGVSWSPPAARAFRAYP